MSQKTIDGTKLLKCIEPYCEGQVAAFDTHSARLYCREHLKEYCLNWIKYSNNIHIEFIRKEESE